jgi:uncharacterized protein with WD repeat
MDLLEKKSIKVPGNFQLSKPLSNNVSIGVKDFAWSPTDHIISYFVPENNDKPATVVLMEIPSRKIIRQKNLFSVTDVRSIAFH